MNFLGVYEPAFVMFNSFFLEFLTPFTLVGHNFLISNMFSTILSVLDAPRGGLKICFAHQKQQSPLSAGIM
jgi:hypothetical protein